MCSPATSPPRLHRDLFPWGKRGWCSIALFSERCLRDESICCKITPIVLRHVRSRSVFLHQPLQDKKGRSRVKGNRNEMVVGVGGQGTACAAGPLLAVGGWEEGLGATRGSLSLDTTVVLRQLGGSQFACHRAPRARFSPATHPRVLWGVSAALCLRVMVGVMVGPRCRLLLTAHTRAIAWKMSRGCRLLGY